MIRALKSLARTIVFGPRKRPMTFREKRDETTKRLRAELAADKARQVEAHLIAYRAVEVALRGEAAE
jgi:hypothetical protein